MLRLGATPRTRPRAASRAKLCAGDARANLPFVAKARERLSVHCAGAAGKYRSAVLGPSRSIPRAARVPARARSVEAVATRNT